MSWELVITALLGAVAAGGFSWITRFFKSRKRKRFEGKTSELLEKYYELEGARKESLKTIIDDDPQLQALEETIRKVEAQIVETEKSIEGMTDEQVHKELRKMGY